MELKNNQDFHTKGGAGENSYAKNSNLQRKIITLSNSINEEAVAKCLNMKPLTSMGIADLGCSSGSNSFMVISNIINTIHSRCSQMGISLPELNVSLNDLPGNDFSNIFMSLPEFYDRMKRDKGIEGCYVSCVGGSFYGRLFPANSLHFVHSSSSLHWLSQVPEGIGSSNKENIYISKTSPPCVAKAYFGQFQKDFYAFLRSRAAEMVTGGQMVLSRFGRSATQATPTGNSSLVSELISKALMSLVSDGLIEVEKVYAFNEPYYAASPDEVKNVVEEEGSFVIDRIEECKVGWNEAGGNYQVDKLSMGERKGKAIRAVIEPLVVSAFGGGIVDELFRRFGKMADDYSSSDAHLIVLFMSLTRSDHK